MNYSDLKYDIEESNNKSIPSSPLSKDINTYLFSLDTISLALSIFIHPSVTSWSEGEVHIPFTKAKYFLSEPIFSSNIFAEIGKNIKWT